MQTLALILGLCGSVTAAGLFFPQVWSSYRTKKTSALSWLGIFIGMTNGVLWVAYGLIKADPFIWATNAILFAGAFLLMLLKRKYD